MIGLHRILYEQRELLVACRSLGRAPAWGQHLRLEARRFARLLVWLLMEVANHYRLLRKVPVYRDIDERAQTFGIIFNY
jgi:hypothetical protein